MRIGRANPLLAGSILAFIVALLVSLGAHPRAEVEQIVPVPPRPLAASAPTPATAAPAPTVIEPAPTATEPAPTADAPAPTTNAAAPAAAAAEPPTEAQPETQPPAKIASLQQGDDVISESAPEKSLDDRIADQLRALIPSARFEKRIRRAPDRQAMQAFYAARDYAPLWISDGRPTARAEALIARLKDAASEGLDAADYPVPEFDRMTDAEALADADIKLTHSAMTFARHLTTGRIAPLRVFAQIEYGDHTPQPAAILKKLAETDDIDTTLDGFDPPRAGFRALKRKLAALRAEGAARAQAARIPPGKVIRLGAKDPRVPLLRKRLGLKPKPHDTTYDRALYKAVRELQRRSGLQEDGIVGSKVVGLINGPKRPDKSQIIDTVRANMERWRWLPRDLGDAYVMVNIPDFTLKVVHDHRVLWRTKIIVGKPRTPTPLTSAPMDSVIVNPSWHVPQSIIQNELLPRYGRDPNIFARMGLVVKRRSDGHLNVVQPPGAGNALGRIKFTFANRFQVYLHDTPNKSLFASDRRAFSHGCMRVQDPTMLGQTILGLAMQGGPTPDAHQLRGMFSRKERVFRLQKRPMVVLTYQTAFVDDAGKLELRNDFYGFDARIASILHSGERRVADRAPPPDPKRAQETMRANREILSRVERGEARNPYRYFERLFR
jgi:murein L,D-transpeptidase YcbB/YkuD